MRVVIIKDFVRTHFPANPLLDYALEVEKITTSKVFMQLPAALYNAPTFSLSLSLLSLFLSPPPSLIFEVM